MSDKALRGRRVNSRVLSRQAMIYALVLHENVEKMFGFKCVPLP